MIKKLLDLVKDKNEIDQKQIWYNGSLTYFEGLKDEILEVEAEIKENNSVYLEDELGDILWDYLNFLVGLEKEGKITSIEKVISRAEKKYSERVFGIKTGTDDEKSLAWNEVKKRQKEENLREHNEKNGK